MNQATLEVRIKARDEAGPAIGGLTGKIQAAGTKMEGFGRKASQVGGTMTRRLTLPLVAAGGAAVKTFTDFDQSMGKIVGLVGVSTKQVDAWGKQVLSLGGKIGKPPTELADALFTVTSAGFRGADAMDVLTAAGKASAAGLGETRSIAEAVTGAINAYGKKNLEASHATDILVATARAGNFETSQLAGALGRVTPFAKTAGASFEDVGGAIALLTRVNNDANESVTQTAALLRAFAGPTKQTQKALEILHLSTDDVRKSMSEKGLVGTLKMLDKKLGGNRDKLREIIPDSQGFSAALQILNASGKDVKGTFGAVAHATGLTEDAFKAAEKTARQKFNVALANLQSAGILIGGSLAPVLTDIAGKVSNVAMSFSNLSPTTQKVIISVGLLVAAIGPALSMIGRMALGVAALTKAWGIMSVAMAGPWGIALGGIAIAVGLLTTGMFLNRSETDRLKAAEDRLKQSTEELKNAQLRAAHADIAAKESKYAVKDAQRAYNKAVKEYGPKSEEAKRAALRLKDAHLNVKDAVNGAKQAHKEELAQEKKNAKNRAIIKKLKDVADAAGAIGTNAFAAGQQLKNIDGHIKVVKSKKKGVGGRQILELSQAYHRAAGGPVEAGQPYIVGERGQEVFVPNRDGRIVPNDQINRTTNHRSVHIGQLILSTKEATREFFKDIDQDALLASKSFAPKRGMGI